MVGKLNDLWLQDDGYVLSSELVLYGTMGVIGVGAGYTAVRDTMNTELNDVAKALGSMDQSYVFTGTSGHSAWTAGSAFFDRADRCDVPPLSAIVQHPPVGRPLVCADVFGPSGALPPHHGPHALPAHAHPALPGVAAPGAGAVVVEQNSKGVMIGEPGPAVVAGAPGLAPVPGHHPHGGPNVGVTIDPAAAGPYLVDVPEGYFHHRPPTGYIGPAAQYHMFLRGQYGPYDCGYHYAPVAAPLVDSPAVIHVGPAVAPHPVAPRDPAWNTIDLGFAKVGDAELKEVEKFKTAKCLHVLGSNVTNLGLTYVATMQQLESLHLIGTQVTDDGMKEIAKLANLRFLHLVGTKITDAGLVHLAGMKKLEELDVRGTPVSDAGLAAIRKTLPTLRVIR